MQMRWSCSMGHPVEAQNEDNLVRKAQEHMRREQGMKISASLHDFPSLNPSRAACILDLTSE